MVLEDNAITLKQIRTKVIEDQDIFRELNAVGLATLDRVLKRNSLRMKQVYHVPFNRNSDRVKGLRRDYVQVSTIFSSTHTLHYIAPTI